MTNSRSRTPTYAEAPLIDSNNIDDSDNAITNYILSSLNTLIAGRKKYQGLEKILLTVINTDLSLNNHSETIKTLIQDKSGKDFLEMNLILQDNLHKRDLELVRKIYTKLTFSNKLSNGQNRWILNLKSRFKVFSGELQLYNSFESNRFYQVIPKLNGPSEMVCDSIIQKVERGIEIMNKGQSKILEFIKIFELKSRQFENQPFKYQFISDITCNLMELCSLLRQQFKLEREFIVPLIKEKIRSI